MKVLTLTWEFPPVITGGLGMACYGIVKELLRLAAEVDLIMPAKGEYYFPLRNVSDADDLGRVITRLGEDKPQKPLSQKQLESIIGSSLSVYQTTGLFESSEPAVEILKKIQPFARISELLNSPDYMFREVRDYTNMAVQIGSQLDFDIIHAHDWMTYPAAMILNKLTGKPLVAHVHATEFDRAGGPGDPRIHDLEYIGMDYADRVIAVSEYTANLIAEKYCISISKIRTIHNAYTISYPNKNYRRIFDEITVLFMGRITLQKGPDYFIEVARRVLEHHKKVRFIMAGSGDMECQILHKTAAMGLGTRFLFAGFLNREEVEKALGSTDIFLLPSVAEPFGITPLEAMSHGAVAIVSKTSGVAEIIENAYKIDFWDINQMVDTILELIKDPEKYKKMSALGRQEVSTLKWEQSVRKIMDVFFELEVMA